jgi:hypothetical protein
MSFRLFVYYCALCGGGAAFVGWLFGRVATGRDPVGEAGVKGLFLGMFVAAALSLLDAVMSPATPSKREARLGILVAVLVGGFGGLMAAMFGQGLYGSLNHWIFLLLGWTLTGLLIGASIGAYSLLQRVLRDEDIRPAWNKLRKGLIGGSAGGTLGGCVFLILRAFFNAVFSDKEGVSLWSPSATGFVALGACIGLAIGLAQVILKEAWLKVESGFRAGREIILSKDEITIGRAEGCDIGLYGDPAVERIHARIVREGGHFLLSDTGTSSGTNLNGERVTGPMPLKQGDRIQIGKAVLSFGERSK